MNDVIAHDDVYAAVEKLRQTGWLISVIATGAAGGLPGNLLSDVWDPPGASANLLEYDFRYAQESLDDLLGFSLDKYCDQTAAIRIAAVAYERARMLIARRRRRPRNEHLRLEDAMGVGITSAVTTTRERRGKDQAFIAVRTIHGFFVMSATLTKVPDHAVSAREWRAMQGRIIDTLVLSAMLQVAGVHGGFVFDESLGIADCHVVSRQDGNPIFGVLPLSSQITPGNLFGNVFWPNGSVSPLSDLDLRNYIVLPGSFSPLHSAHVRIALLIETATRKQVIFQISGRHPIKGDIPVDELIARARQFEHRLPVIVLPDAALYVDKVRAFAGADMLIGADVVYAILDPKYYAGGISGRDAALAEMFRSGTRFHVVGRFVEGHGYQELSDIPIPGKFVGLFVPVSYREDLSSTELRQMAGATA